MAVYTHLSDDHITRLVGEFGLSRPTRIAGISEGTINSIYAVESDDSRFILRVLEDRSEAAAHFEEALLDHLLANGLPVPVMLKSPRHGGVLRLTERQHVSVFRWMQGRELLRVEVGESHVQQIGVFLATLHEVTRSFESRRHNRFAPDFVHKFLLACEQVADSRSDQDANQHLSELRAELSHFQWPTGVLSSTIHADLFVDNAFFEEGKLSGILDFEMACTGPAIYDLAVALLDWTVNEESDLEFDVGRLRALLGGYQRVRTLSDAEYAQLFPMCKYVATRYATSRFFDFEVCSRPEATRTYKNYREYLTRLVVLKRLGEERFQELIRA